MNQERMIDILEEKKANKVGVLTCIQNTSNRDMVEVEDEGRAVEEMIDKELTDKQKAPTKHREFGCLAHYWGGKIRKFPSDFVLLKLKLFLNLWLS